MVNREQATNPNNPPASPVSPRSIGLGVYFLAGPMVVALAGIGGHVGEKLGSGPGYWAGCYAAAIAAAGVFGWIFARLFQGHPLDWTLGALGILVCGHVTWILLGGKVTGAPASGSDRFLIGSASVIGLFLGLTADRTIVSRRRIPKETGKRSPA